MESLILKASFFTLDDILSILVSMGKILIALLIIIRINLFSFDLCFHSRKYKRIKKKEIVENKDIPNLDAFYINTLNSFNKDFKPIYFMLNDISVLKYLLLKWYKDGAIRIENNGIVFSNVGFENSCEQHIYTFFRMISKDNYLSIKRLKKWASSNYKSYIKTYKLPKQVIIKSLVRNGHIDSKHGFTDDVIYEDSKKLYSFKLFIMKIIKSEDRVDFDFYLWYEYLSLAYLLGLGNKLLNKFKQLYPEIIDRMVGSNFNYEDVLFINKFINASTRKIAIQVTFGDHLEKRNHEINPLYDFIE